MSDPTARLAALRSDLTALSGMLAEAHEEYTSKRRLRDIAVAALSTLVVQYNTAVEKAEADEAQQATDSGLLIPSTELVTP